MLLVIVPFWTSFLIRIYAWINILQHDGLLNDALMALHIVVRAAGVAVHRHRDVSRHRLFLSAVHGPAAVCDAGEAGCVAAGGRRRSRLLARQAFWLVTLPLSLPGVGAGALLCFIPITGEFVIPDLLAGSDSMMIGQTLWGEFFTNSDWPVASAIAVVLLVLLLAPLLVYDRLQRKQLEAR